MRITFFDSGVGSLKLFNCILKELTNKSKYQLFNRKIFKIELDKIVQNNASAAEKMSGMSESLQEQANKLQVSINYFRFKDEQSIDNQMVHHMIEAPKKE